MKAARYLFTDKPTAAEAHAVGLTVEEATPAAPLVWHDNATPVRAFTCMRSQWRVGPAGPYGLDYGALPSVLRMLAIPRHEWQDTFYCIQQMEDAALAILRKETR